MRFCGTGCGGKIKDWEKAVSAAKAKVSDCLLPGVSGRRERKIAEGDGLLRAAWPRFQTV
jgi:hypothetical protein